MVTPLLLADAALFRWRAARGYLKALNSLKNDIGPANIKLRTAVEYVKSAELVVPDSPKNKISYTAIVTLLESDAGTVAATAAVIGRAHKLFDDFLRESGDLTAQAVRVEYFKQGARFYNRMAATEINDPLHSPCPGDGGCRFETNYQALRTALGLPAS
jgi:hypothetical protein